MRSTLSQNSIYRLQSVVRSFKEPSAPFIKSRPIATPQLQHHFQCDELYSEVSNLITNMVLSGFTNSVSSSTQIHAFPFFNLLFQHSSTDGIPIFKYLQLNEDGRLTELEVLINFHRQAFFLTS
ncbi:unnamed protein product [Ambrosiozyma monospora]|uniref:Unnamed protein product n=1 Tax=Ambrosiozyma monospora TaxID=43982 RepID=A0A9W7DM05_AMBMO|nr:unnamed protein product [Ambrosiozyma monospora]